MATTAPRTAPTPTTATRTAPMAPTPTRSTPPCTAASAPTAPTVAGRSRDAGNTLLYEGTRSVRARCSAPSSEPDLNVKENDHAATHFLPRPGCHCPDPGDVVRSPGVGRLPRRVYPLWA